MPDDARNNVTVVLGGVNAEAAAATSLLHAVRTDNPHAVTAAQVNFTPLGTGAVVRSVQDRLREPHVSAKDFGAVGDGVTDDRAALVLFFNHLRLNGGVGYIPPGVYNISNFIQIFDGAKPFSVIGAGRDLVMIKRVSSAFGTPFDIRRTNDLCFDGITIDAGYDAFPTNANNGVSVLDCSRVVFRRFRVRNYANTPILYYTTVQNTYEGGVYDDVEVYGMTVANNGLFFQGMDRSVMRHCRVFDCKGGSPSYGLQFKDNCRWSTMDDCYVENCTAGIAFGQETGTGVSYTSVSNIVVRNCTTGVVTGYADDCVITGLVIDQGGASGRPIDIQNSTGVAISGVVLRGVVNLNESVRFIGSQDCVVDVALADFTGSTTSYYVAFWAGAARNTIRYRRIVSVPTGTLLSASRIYDVSGGADNRLEFGGDVWTQATGFLRSVVGSGAPEGAVTATVGSQYQRIDGGAGTTLYVKENGSGNTGWATVGGYTASSVAITGGTINGTVIGGTTPAAASVTSLSAGTGSQAAPSLSFSAETGTGLYRHAAGVLGMSVTGTLVVRVGTTSMNPGTSGGVSLGSASFQWNNIFLAGGIFFGAAGNSVTFGNAAPTTGTWVQGDVRFNASAAVGQPNGWRCTVGGAPGTWVAMPNL